MSPDYFTLGSEALAQSTARPQAFIRGSERAVSPERFGNPSFFCPRYTFALGMFFWYSGSPSLTQS